MFHELLCLLLACLKIMVCASSSSATSSIAHSKELLPYHSPKSRIQDNLLLHKFYRGPASKQIHIRPDRSKRGIVLIDEDFDVPPDPGVKQGWSDGDVHSNKVADVMRNATRISSEGEGSGSSETMDKELLLTKSIRFATPYRLTRVSNHKANPGVEYANSEASGNGDFPFDTNATETSEEVINVAASSTFVSTSTQLSKEETGMTPSTTHVSANSEASKEDTDGVISSTHVAEISEDENKDIDESNKHLCLNFTCDSKDLIIFPSRSETVPEGTNLTLTCFLANATEQGLLKWYKYNESDHLLLDVHKNGQEINFGILNSIQYHSGTYMCFRFTEQSCCHRKLDIIVYEMPNYKKHFIVIGSIAAASLLVCLLIGICKSVKTKKYENTAELQNVEKPFLL